MNSPAINGEISESKSSVLDVIFTGSGARDHVLDELSSSFNVIRLTALNELLDYLNDQTIHTLPEILLIEADRDGYCFETITQIKKNPLWKDLIIVVLASESDRDKKLKALQLKVHDYYIFPFPVEHLIERINFLVKFKFIKPRLSVLEVADIIYHVPLHKRVLDITLASLGMVVLSPLMVLTALVIKLDSAGPVICKCKRVGTGYQIFNFYKFRSTSPNVLSEPTSADKEPTGERSVSRLGRFLRWSHIDITPQLINVLKGEMSMVGNRPLLLDEAEQLTSNEWSLRFLAPVGVTGLWQIKRWKKNSVSDRERKKFDNFYASKYSFLFDIEILLKTLPALLFKNRH